MSATMNLIFKNILSVSATNVEFTSIPSIYTDLLIVCHLRTDEPTSAASAIKMRFNGASDDTNHSNRHIYGNSSTATSGSDSFARVGYACTDNNTASTFANTEIYIPNYTGSTNKSFSATSVHENNSATANAAYIIAIAGLWSSTNAITSVKIMPTTSVNFKAGSSFYLYGITKMDDGSRGYFGPAATGGDEVFTTGDGYKVHVFKTSGTLNVTAPGEVEYLVVAGGGGGASDGAGGGGAGGYKSSIMSLYSGTYNIIIGAGGTGGVNAANGIAGSNSYLGPIESTGGGYGAYWNNGAGGNGGSGGGAGASNTSFGAGTGISGQGNNGGLQNISPYIFGGGGGGAGAVGGNARAVTSTKAGNGGNGLLWLNGNTYAGGGGGSADSRASTPSGGDGGSGGGGAGGATGNGSNGTANTGGGGGGGAYNAPTKGNGGNGGSGIVIIRYRI